MPDTEVRRTLVADDVEGGEDGRARRVRDPGLAVQDAADRCLRHARLPRDIRQLAGHVARLLQILATGQSWASLSPHSLPAGVEPRPTRAVSTTSSAKRS